MKFSIILPVHNAEDRVTKALDVIKSQTFKDYEIICVCDACTDRSAAICRAYTNKVYEVDFVNDGLTRNVGIDHAEGDYILFHDDDDWWDSDNVLENLNDATESYPRCDVFCFGFHWKGYGIVTPMHFNGKSVWSNVWSKMWKRSFIGETRFRNIKSVSDEFFCNDMFAKHPRTILINYAFYVYNYMRPGSITETNAREQSNDNRTEG